MASNARILRDMARDYSIVSSTGSAHGTISADSTMSDFNPSKDEASMSTQRLPELRTTAKKYGRWAPREPTDIVINTSAIGRVFKGFSDGSSSDNSVEIARAPRTSQRYSSIRAPQPEYSDFDSSQAINTGSVKVLSTPQISQTKTTVLRDALRNHASKKENVPRRDSGSHKENIPPSNTQKSTKLSPYTSHASRTTSGERRTLAELHAQVADDTEGSFIGDDRPATVTFQPKNTRFSNVKLQQQSNAANVSTKRQEVDDLAEKLRVVSGTPSKSQLRSHNSTALSNTPNPTQQSFILPNMTHVSEITPPSFNKGTGVALPGEEQDIYVNIDFLQDRVTDLEAQLAQSRVHSEQVEIEIRHLKRQSVTQGERFKIQMERDQAITQLSAYLTQIEQLEVENQELQQFKSLNKDEGLRFRTERDKAVVQAADFNDQNEHLKKQVNLLSGQKQQLERRSNELLAQNERLETRVGELVSHNKKLKDDIKQCKYDNEDLNIALDAYKNAASEIAVQADNTTQSLEEESRKTRRQQEVIVKLQDHLTADLIKSKRQSRKKQSSNGNQRQVTVDRPVCLSRTTERSFEVNEQSVMSDEYSDYASIVGPGFMKALSQQAKEKRTADAEVDEERSQVVQCAGSSHAPSIIAPAANRKTDRTRNQDDLTGRFSIKTTRTAKSDVDQNQDDLTARFSITPAGIEQNGENQTQENLTGRFSMKSAARVEDEHTVKSTTSHRRHHSETSIHAARRRGNQIDDMTSAFIIPDISSNPIIESLHPRLSASARQVLDGLCRHECTNCTVCTRVASFDAKKQPKQNVVIPQPVPVSERMPERAPYEDEPTVRPSVDPSLALATLIKQTEDEIAHLKIENTRITTAYTKHDASLGMRKRTALKKRIDELLLAIEERSNHLYGLYDVLEGQKESRLMNDEGITEELPWEGIHDE